MSKQDDVRVTVTHHDIQPPTYNVDALKKDIENSKKHVRILQNEIDKQLANQKNLQKLIQDQEKRNKQPPYQPKTETMSMKDWKSLQKKNEIHEILEAPEAPPGR